MAGWLSRVRRPQQLDINLLHSLSRFVVSVLRVEDDHTAISTATAANISVPLPLRRTGRHGLLDLGIHRGLVPSSPIFSPQFLSRQFSGFRIARLSTRRRCNAMARSGDATQYSVLRTSPPTPKHRGHSCPMHSSCPLVVPPTRPPICLQAVPCRSPPYTPFLPSIMPSMVVVSAVVPTPTPTLAPSSPPRHALHKENQPEKKPSLHTDAGHVRALSHTMPAYHPHRQAADASFPAEPCRSASARQRISRR